MIGIVEVDVVFILAASLLWALTLVVAFSAGLEYRLKIAERADKMKDASAIKIAQEDDGASPSGKKLQRVEGRKPRIAA